MQSLGYAGTAAGVHDEDDDTGRRMLQWQAVLLTTLRRTDAAAADAATAAMAMRIWEICWVATRGGGGGRFVIVGESYALYLEKSKRTIR
jgi:hypothetical protein